MTAIHYQEMKVSQLHVADYNPRKITPKEMQKLERSMATFGVVEPIIWNKTTGRVVGGHQRLKVLQANDIKTAMVGVIEISEAEEKKLNLALNKIKGDWDVQKLSGMMQELRKEDLTLTGYDLPEVSVMLAQQGFEGKLKMSDNQAVQLLFNEADHARFTDAIQALSKRYNSKNVQDTILKALEEAQ